MPLRSFVPVKKFFKLERGNHMSPEPAGSLLPPTTALLSAAPDTAAASQPAGGGALSILLLLVLILINGFFASAEIAVITLNDNKVKKMAEDGNKKAQRVLRLTENSSRFLSTIQIGVTLAGFLSSASAAQNFAPQLTAAILKAAPALPHTVVDGVSTFLVTLLLSYFSLVLGELVPKKIAMQKAEALAFRFVGILQAIAVIFRPFIALLSVSTNGVMRLLGLNPNDGEQTVTEEEILMMVDAGEEKGVIGENAKDMISNIFDFSDTTVVEVMTHRTDIHAVEDTASVADVVALSMEEGCSRIPVYHEDLDTVVGILYVKDLLRYVGPDAPPDVPLTQLMRPAYFIPEGKRCSDLFKEMTERKVQIAIIVDEYGGTEGLITMEDLLESIVGNIQDEYDHEEEEIRKLAENKFTVDGTTPIDEIEDLVGVELPETEYDTIAGLVMERLGRIPSPGEHPSVSIPPLTLTVGAVADRRITKILIEKKLPLPAEEQPEPDEKAERRSRRDKRD